jgi:two-component system cell cycle sensor histidine kinase/response regulator CckA
MAIGDHNPTAARKPEEAESTGQADLRFGRHAARLGEMSAAVAHDFNKLLTIMLGYSELMLADLSSDNALRPFVEEINYAVYRGARLTRYLLDFSHAHQPKPELVNLNHVVQVLDDFLRGLIGPGVDLVRDLTPAIRPVRVDRAHLDQVLATLVLTARDASPAGGCVTIETFNAILPRALPVHDVEIPPGAYGCVGVRDDSVAADSPTSGAALSLAGSGIPLVQCLVQQNGGIFLVDHQLEKGRAFRIYLPAADGP